MEYISHSDYTSILKNFGKETPKEVLKESLEKEGNAFTAALAKTPKGGDLKVGDKVVGKDKTNYDAPVKKEGTESTEYPGSWGMREDSEAIHDRATAVAERLKAQGMDEEDVHLYLVDDMNLSNVTAQAVCDSVFGANEGILSKIGSKIGAFAAGADPKAYEECRADGKSINRLTTYNGVRMSEMEACIRAKGAKFGATAYKGAPGFVGSGGMEEGLNLPSQDMQATGQTIQTVEEDGHNAAYNFSVLSQTEREQLKEFIKSYKTIGQEIKKLVEKAKGGMMEGGDTTNKVMKIGKDAQEGPRMSDAEAEAMVAKHEKEQELKKKHDASIR